METPKDTAENRETPPEREQERTEIFNYITNKQQQKTTTQHEIYNYLLIYCYSNNIDIKTSLGKLEFYIKDSRTCFKTITQKIIEILNQLTNEQLFNFIIDTIDLDFNFFERFSHNAKRHV